MFAAGAPECEQPSRSVSAGGEGAWRSGPSLAGHPAAEHRALDTFLAHPEARGRAPRDPGAVPDQGVLAGPTD